MDEDKKFKSEIREKLAKIEDSFDTEYVKRLSAKQSELSSKHGNLSPNGDSSATPSSNSSKKERPKANCEETTSELPDHEIHGFINEALFLKNSLMKQKKSEGFKALAIVGKYGVGKTTLCQVVFNSKEVKQAYLPRLWVSMYNKETDKDEDQKIAVVKRILRSLGVEKERLEHMEKKAEEEKKIKEEKGERDEETVKEKVLSKLLYALNLNLMKKKYLIVLDDVWEDNDWNQRLEDEKNQEGKTHLSCGFPKGYGGRVIVTSRDEELAKKIVGEEENVQRLFPRTDAESVWKIYRDAVGKDKGKEVNPRYPGKFKKELMDKSRGAPLVARMLAKIEPLKVDETGGSVVRKKSF